MDIKHLQFSFRMYWANMKGLLNMVAEGIILVASLASLFILVYQFGFKYSAHVTHMLETSRVYLLLAFFTGISLRYILKFKEIIQEKMLYLDIGIYFFLFAVLSGKVFFKEAIHQSLPYLGFLTEPLFVYFLLLLLSAIHLSRQTFTLLQSHIKPSLLFLLSFVFVILVGSGLLMLPNATVHGIHFVDALFISTTSVCVTGLTTVDVATTFTHTGHIIIMFLIQIGGIGVMTFTSFFALSFMGHSSFTSKLVLKDMLNEDRVNGLFRVILNILFVTLFIEGVGAYLIYLDIKGGLPGGTQEEVFYAVFHAVSAFCNAGISTLSGNMYDPLVAQKYNLHVWIALLIVFGGLGFPIVFNYLKLLRHLLVNTFKIVIGQQKHYIHTPRIININTYIVMISTLVLLAGGTFFYYLLEMDNTLAGLPFRGQLANAFLGVCHSMAHKLGAYHHLPHGIANALLIELVMKYNADPAPVKMGTFSQYPYPKAKERYAEFGRFCGVTGKNDDEVFDNFIKAIAELKEKVGIKRTIKEYGVKEEDFLATLDEMVENAFNDQCTGANPRYPLMSELKEMYLKAYYGK